MTDFYDAFEYSPVPPPGPDAVAPEPFRGIYGMPAFATIPTTDLAASMEFWTKGLGFFELFAIPGVLVHLRRWAFQDVLLRVAEEVPATAPAAAFNFACVLNEVEGIAADCRALRPDAVTGPVDTPWNTRDLEIVTPENARVVYSAAKVFVPESREARNLKDMGIVHPSQREAGDGGE